MREGVSGTLCRWSKACYGVFTPTRFEGRETVAEESGFGGFPRRYTEAAMIILGKLLLAVATGWVILALL